MNAKVLASVAAISLFVSCGKDENNDTPDDTGIVDAGDLGSGTDLGEDLGPDDAGVDMPPDIDMGPTALYEMILDDDVADSTFAPQSADGFITGTIVAQRFEPPADGKLSSVRVVIGNGAGLPPAGDPTAAFELLVYAADGAGGTPGTELLAEPKLVQASQAPLYPLPASVTWVDVPLTDDAIAVSTDGFFVGVRFPATDVSESPFIAMDEQTEPDASWLWTPEDEWAPLADGLVIDAQPMFRATVEIPESAVPTSPIILSNAPRDCRAFDGGQLPGNLGTQWAVARLAPEATPFVVESIRYELRNGIPDAPAVQCDAGIPHRIAVFVDGASPSADPMFHVTTDIDLEPDDFAGGESITPILLQLQDPLTVGDDEFLYVAVEVVAGDPAMCIGICGDSNALENNWLASSAGAPYDWVNFDTIGAAVNLTTRAYGHVE